MERTDVVNEESPRLREEELAFFGRMGADVSHEMRNVLSIIGEHAGLLGDLIAVSKGGKRFDVERLKRVSTSILRQVEKGTGTMERFSRFAHAADERTAHCDLAEVGRNTAALLGRHVALAGCRLETEIPDGPVPVSVNAFSVQHALFSALEAVLESIESGGTATIRLAAEGAGALLTVSGPAASGASAAAGPSPRLAALRAAVEEMGGSVEATGGEGTVALAVRIPAQ